MMIYKTIKPGDAISDNEKNQIANFLFDHLDQFGDEKSAILKCIEFALDDKNKFGGFILVSTENEALTGAVIVNKTGMSGYIPENILVYIAVHKNYRGKGLGKSLMKKAMQQADGDIKLHVEPENPARYLYENLGFTSKYLEMRLTR
jgi:[ribosomal protein S18]-alanine N-acetyltransferase